jgi:transketolase C-terminal domain/subunit
MFYFKGLGDAIAELCPESMFTSVRTMGSFDVRESIKNA